MDTPGTAQSLFTGLGVPERGLVALCGGGGKTTLMYRLAAQAAERGLAVVCTTTTKVFVPTVPDEVRSLWLEQEADLEDVLRSALKTNGPWPVFLAAARIDGGGRPEYDPAKLAGPGLEMASKLAGLAPETLDRLSRAFPDILFLVEADGAARKPLKAPAAHEPVMPSATVLSVAVIGLDALNRPLTPDRVHRPERVSALTGVPLGGLVTLEAVRVLITHPQGLLQHCPATSRRVVFGNKADAFPPPPLWEWPAGSALHGWCR